jgi:hypothetical protein
MFPFHRGEIAMSDVKSTKHPAAGIAAATLGLAIVGLYACGGSSADSGLGCSVNLAGQQFCYAYSNLSSDQTSTVKQGCSSQGGSIVSTCPKDGLVGCCSVTVNGISGEACYYFGTSSLDQMACAAGGGTWTDGSGALSTSSGSSTGGGAPGSSSGTSSSGGPCVAGDLGCACYPNDTCNAGLTCDGGICTDGSTSPACTTVAGGPVCCPQGYCTLGTAHGYAFAYSDMNDGGQSSASLSADGSLCVSGTVVDVTCTDQSCFSSFWGAGMGVNVNQATGTASPAANYAAAGSAGITYALDGLPPNLRLVVGDSTTDYCVILNTASGTVPWAKFNSACWDPASGVALSGPPARFTSVRFQVATDDTYEGFADFAFCIDRLAF